MESTKPSSNSAENGNKSKPLLGDGYLSSKDLRAGNLIYLRNSDYSEKAKKGWDISEIVEIHNNGGGYFNEGKSIGKKFEDVDRGCGYFSEKCDRKPIPLNEDWLIKLGFKYKEETDCYHFYNLIINKQMVMMDIDIHVHLKSVHHIQNLYFILTGFELTIA